MQHHLPTRGAMSNHIRRLTALIIVLLLTAAAAQAGGLGVPSSRAGIGFGNLPEFSGLRFNVMDRGVRQVHGVNVTLWAPMGGFGRSGDCAPCRNGSYVGLGLNLLGSSADRMSGVHVGGLGLAVQEHAAGILVGGLGIGGGDLTGIVLGGLGVGGGNMTGIFTGGLGVGGDDMTGIFLGGLGVGGDDMTGIFLGGLGVGGDRLEGLALGGAIRTLEAHGVALSVVYQRTERLYGISTGLYNRADHATGLMLGLFNSARTLRGVQIGLLNRVGSGPSAARWLPLVNARF